MNDLYRLARNVRSRAISFENPTGAPGGGGRATSPLGVGRKGAPARMIESGECVQLADIEGPGVLRHLWMATYDIADTMRGLVIRMYWEDQLHPSVEAPIGDFFGFAHGASPPYASAVHSVGERLALNIWLPMPFFRRARVTITNELAIAVPLFFQIDYTVGDEIEADSGYLHALFRREISTVVKADFELLPRRIGRGRYLGAVIGVRPTHANWWGEGAVKIYLDGDDEFASIVGTGAEDYVGLSWGLQRNAFVYHGASLVTRGRTDTGPVSMYRWHLPDPVYWHESIRVTLQQIGLAASPEKLPRSLQGYRECLVERSDDYSTCTFWYEPLPSAALPVLPALSLRLEGLSLAPDLNALPLQPGFSLPQSM
ncbi:glycoside hydrolase family 172 protein [Steroidobacter sp.]|uniref:glycoside hydrolase family 172 protein n=1 Tax=Steroidobacter sp. TaxID=1978227 RepID=UPI001A4F56AF|nr:glycoside hydrolase family 172 protein [Steroidobacter sp.]MBL8264795.1 DUF2961 domain-containing protein [Steroidobacter sp.]